MPDTSTTRIAISDGSTAPGCIIILAWPAMFLGAGIWMESPIIAVLVLIGFSAFFIANFRTEVLEADMVARRLSMVTDNFGYWRRTDLVCSFDQCEAVGVIEDYWEGRNALYLRLRNERHPRAFAVSTTTPAQAASELSRMLGVPRKDIGRDQKI